MTIKNKLLKLALVCCISGITTISVLAADFNDVTPSYWAYNEINNLSSSQILGGYSDSTFRPDDPVTRAEFATMMIKALGKESIQAGNYSKFSDVPSSFWGATNINKAFKTGIVNGFPDGKFYPHNYVTKIQVVAALSSAMANAPVSENYANRIINNFQDKTSIPKWAVSSVANLADNNILVNYPNQNKIEPSKNITRAEVATMLFRLRDTMKITSAGTTQTTTIAIFKPYYDELDQSSKMGIFSEVLVTPTDATILADTIIPAELKNAVSTATSKIGDKVYLRINQNISTQKGQLIIMRGSQIEGRVSNVISSKTNKANTSVKIDFDTLVSPQGTRSAIIGVVELFQRDIVAQSMQNIGQSANGAAIKDAASAAFWGYVMGKATPNTNGKDAAIQNATAALGIGDLGTTMTNGGEINLKEGQTLFVKLLSPISIDSATQKVIVR